MCLASLRVDMPKASFVGLHPEILVTVNKKLIKASSHSHLLQQTFRMAIATFRHRVKNGIVHALTHPQLTVSILIDGVYIVVAQRHRVLDVRIIGAEAVAVVTVQTVRSPYPYVTL